VEQLRRRQFLVRTGLFAVSAVLVQAGTTARTARAASERSADILIVGGGIGGVAAALAALQLGRTVLLTEETDWLGGQLSAQAVPPDEHPWIEDIGCSRQYRSFRAALRDYYRANLPLRDEARTHPRLNPGDAKWSCLAHEPSIAHNVIVALLAPFVARGQLTILAGQRPIAVERQGDWLRTVTVASVVSGEQTLLRAAIMLDATPLGDLLDLGQVEHTIGAESQAQTGEPHALAGAADPRDQQAITWGAALDSRPGEDHTIARPPD
jgi:glycine/D-amino acid oxidase-like deaminating enzyme